MRTLTHAERQRGKREEQEESMKRRLIKKILKNTVTRIRMQVLKDFLPPLSSSSSPPAAHVSSRHETTLDDEERCVRDEIHVQRHQRR